MEKFASDPKEKFGTNLKVQINERGDKDIVIFTKGKQIVVNQYNQYLKDKKLKKEKELKVIGENFTYESDKIEFRIYTEMSMTSFLPSSLSKKRLIYLRRTLIGLKFKLRTQKIFLTPTTQLHFMVN